LKRIKLNQEKKEKKKLKKKLETIIYKKDDDIALFISELNVFEELGRFFGKLLLKKRNIIIETNIVSCFGKWNDSYKLLKNTPLQISERIEAKK